MNPYPPLSFFFSLSHCARVNTNIYIYHRVGFIHKGVSFSLFPSNSILHAGLPVRQVEEIVGAVGSLGTNPGVLRSVPRYTYIPKVHFSQSLWRDSALKWPFILNVSASYQLNPLDKIHHRWLHTSAVANPEIKRTVLWRGSFFTLTWCMSLTLTIGLFSSERLKGLQQSLAENRPLPPK